MLGTELEDAALARLCQEVTGRLLVEHDWHLRDHEDLARRTLAQLRASATADPYRAALYVYSQALHAACSGGEGAQRQNIGYTELFRYLYDSARRRYPDVYEDATQRALRQVFLSFERCRQPGTFLSFAFQQLLDAARAVRRQEERPRRRAAPGALIELTAELPDRSAVDPATELIAGELRARFEQLAVAFLQKYPRATRQFKALRLKYIDGLDEAAISRELGTPVASVYVLRARAVKKLRAEPDWRTLAIEFGILPEDERGSPE
jgi:RNA polymerase sigma factor (sigma-70 family)